MLLVADEKTQSFLTLTTKEINSQERVEHKFIDKEEKQYVMGNFRIVCRERGKIVPGTFREGHNIWTLTGREYSALLKSYQSYGPDTPFRNDRIRYIGFGSGTQPEVSTVTSLVNPIAWNAGNQFLAEFGIPTFPLAPDRTTVQYTRVYGLLELSVTGTVTLQEAGLFTDGGSPTYAPGTRDVTLVNALAQAPMAYKSFESLKKTQNFELEVDWQLRHS